jgi:hypothetical protein
MATFNEQMQQLYHKYRDEVAGEGPINLRLVADWMIKNGHWRPQPDALVRQCSDQLATALRDEYYTDPQGRRVRTNHAVRIQPKEKGEQSHLWDDIRTAGRDHMELSFQQRRQGIVFDCQKLMIDAASFNQNGDLGTDGPIQLSFNFAADLAELDSLNLALVMIPPSGPQLPSWLSRDAVPQSASQPEPSHP